MNVHTQASLQAWGIAFLRIVVGLVFVMHGGQKLFVYGLDGVAGGFAKLGLPLPMVSAILAMAAEFLGGLALLLGLFTRYAAVPIAFTMLVAWITAHPKGFFLPTGPEYVLVLFSASVLFILAGPGSLALDNVLAKRTRRASPDTAQAPAQGSNP